MGERMERNRDREGRMDGYRRNEDAKTRDARRASSRLRTVTKFQLPKDAQIEYKNFHLLQKYVTERGKIISRRVSGISAKDQRKLVEAIKRARFLALLSTGGYKK